MEVVSSSPPTKRKTEGKGEGRIANGPRLHVASAFPFPTRGVFSANSTLLDQGSLQGCVAMGQ